MKVRKIILFILCLMISVHVSGRSAQKDTIIYGEIQEVSILASKIKMVLPWTYSKDTMINMDKYQNNLRNALDRRPGIQAFNSENFAQDLRISIRGFGSRSAFGVRGIRLYFDEVPLTSPDGTSQLDEISIYDIQSMEIVHSGLSAHMGNASGGAISFVSTNPKGKEDHIQLHNRVNSFGAFDLGFRYNASGSNVSNIFSVNHHRFKGKREFSMARTSTLYNKTIIKLSDRLTLNLITGAYYSPEGNDPGGLNGLLFEQNRWQANARNLQFGASESVSGLHVAIKSDLRWSNKSRLKSMIFYRKRNFKGKIPNENAGVIALNRDFLGMTNSADYSGIANTNLVFGHTIEIQQDQRKLYQNLNGNSGPNTADQNEIVYNNAIFQQLQYAKGIFSVHQLLRYDISRYQLVDHYTVDGLQNGQRNFNYLNGAIGFGVQVFKNATLFGNMSTSFEMPTLNELTNNPDGFSNFNPSLRAEKAFHKEIGFKSNNGAKLHWSISCFNIAIRDQIQAFELSSLPGKTFYRNTDKTSRNGVECDINTTIFNTINVGINYTFSSFRFKEYLTPTKNLKGNTQPLIPKHKFNISIEMQFSQYVKSNFMVGFSDKMWLDDLNLTETKSYFETNFQLSTTSNLSSHFIFGVQISNVFNTLQYSNFRANAAGARYYEAASPRHFGLFIQYSLLN